MSASQAHSRSGVAVALTLATLCFAISLLPKTPAVAQTAGCLPTSERTIGPRGFPGLGVKNVARVHTDALRFTRAEGFHREGARKEADKLIAEGFVSGTSQLYFGKKHKTRGDQGLAFTIQFGTAAQAAAAFQSRFARVLEPGPWKRFTVAEIPGSEGVLDKNRGSGASNVYFTEGPYFYGLGRYVKSGGTAVRAVTNAAEKLFSRVVGTTVCP